MYGTVAQVIRSLRHPFMAIVSIVFFYPAQYHLSFFFFLNDPAPPEIYPLPLHAALPISAGGGAGCNRAAEKIGAFYQAHRHQDRARRCLLEGRRISPALSREARPAALPHLAEIGRAHV